MHWRREGKWIYVGFKWGQPSTSGPKSGSHGSFYKGSFSLQLFRNQTSEAEGGGYRLCHKQSLITARCSAKVRPPRPSPLAKKKNTPRVWWSSNELQQERGGPRGWSQKMSTYWDFNPFQPFPVGKVLALPRLIFKHRPWGPSTALLRSGPRAQLRYARISMDHDMTDWSQRIFISSGGWNDVFIQAAQHFALLSLVLVNSCEFKT